jgi:hypothetical protein
MTFVVPFSFVGGGKGLAKIHSEALAGLLMSALRQTMSFILAIGFPFDGVTRSAGGEVAVDVGDRRRVLPAVLRANDLGMLRGKGGGGELGRNLSLLLG